MRVEVSKQYEIAAAHFQPNYDGKCRNLHGHNYRVELTAVGDPDGLDINGMLIDFGDMKKHLDDVIGIHDHSCLNDTYETPSIETVAIDWLNSLNFINPSYKKLTVWENDRSSCTVYADDYWPAEG